MFFADPDDTLVALLILAAFVLVGCASAAILGLFEKK
jgi:uncharacterized protein YcfL